MDILSLADGQPAVGSRLIIATSLPNVALASSKRIFGGLRTGKKLSRLARPEAICVTGRTSLLEATLGDPLVTLFQQLNSIKTYS